MPSERPEQHRIVLLTPEGLAMIESHLLPDGTVHYFEDGISLCGKWMFSGNLTPNQEGSSPDDCASCRKKLAAKK